MSGVDAGLVVGPVADHNRYRLEEALRAGRSPGTWRAWDTRSRQHVVVKLEATLGGIDDVSVERVREAFDAVRSLGGRHVVTVLDCFFGGPPHRLRRGRRGSGQASHCYLVMEYVEGQDLASASLEKRMTLAAKVAYAGQLCSGVAALHAEGLLHRDIKPANAMISYAEWPADPGRRARGLVLVDLSDVRVGPVWKTQVSLTTPGFSAPFRRTRAGTDTVGDDVYATVMTVWWMVTTSRRLPDTLASGWQDAAIEIARLAVLSQISDDLVARRLARTLTHPLTLSEGELADLDLLAWWTSLDRIVQEASPLVDSSSAGVLLDEAAGVRRRKQLRVRPGFVAAAVVVVVVSTTGLVIRERAGRATTLATWSTRGLRATTTTSYAGSVVFVAAEDSGSGGATQDVAVDALTGRVLWRRPGADLPVDTAPRPPLGFVSTGFQGPGTDLGVELEAYGKIAGVGQVIVARDATTGAQEWTQPAPFGAFSLASCGSAVLCLVDSNNAEIDAVDPVYGTERWRVPGNVVLTNDATSILVGRAKGSSVSGINEIQSLSAATGNASRTLPVSQLVSGAADVSRWQATRIGDEFIVSLGGDSATAPATAVAGIDARSGAIRWRAQGISLTFGITQTPVGTGPDIQPLVGLDAERRLVRLDPDTGAPLWHSRPVPSGIDVSSGAVGLTADLSALWLSGQDNATFGIDLDDGATAKPSLVWFVQRDPYVVPPAGSGTTAYAGNGTRLRLVAEPSGRPVPDPRRVPTWLGPVIGGRVIWTDSSGELHGTPE